MNEYQYDRFTIKIKEIDSAYFWKVLNLSGDILDDNSKSQGCKTQDEAKAHAEQAANMLADADIQQLRSLILQSPTTGKSLHICTPVKVMAANSLNANMQFFCVESKDGTEKWRVGILFEECDESC